MQLIRIELKKLLCRRQIWILLALLMASVFLDFFSTCEFYRGTNLTEIPSAYELMIINNYANPPTGLLFCSFLFFLVTTLMGSDLFLEEIELGIHTNILSRISRKQMIISKGCAISILVFCTVIVCLLISQLLAVVAFPLQGNYTSKITYNELMEPDKNRILSYFQNYMPYLNSIIFIFIRGVTGAVAAFFAFSLTFVPYIKKYMLLLIPMLFYIFYSLTTSLIATKIEDIPLSNLIETNILAVNGYGRIWMCIAFLLVQLVAGGVLIWKGIKIDDIFL